MKEMMRMKLEFNNLVGLLSMVGTVAGMVLAGTFYPYNPLYALPFVLLAVISFITFVAFLYHFLKYAQYVFVYDEDPEAEEQKK